VAGKIDPITAQVIRSALVAVAEEMKLTLVRTAYNPLIYEVHDFATAVISAKGEMLAQSEGLPGFLLSLPATVRNGLGTIGEENFEDGDIIIANLPYTSGTHLSDTAIYMPVIYEGELVAFASTMAHWADIGGKNPGGWCTDSTDIYQEGMIFEDLKLCRAGEPNEELFQHIYSNVRFPELVQGDLQAQIASCRVGARRYTALCEKYGSANLRQSMEWIFDGSEEMVRSKIADWPKGSYVAECCTDHDGVELDKPRLIKMTVNIHDDSVVVDLAGSSETTKGPVNCPLIATKAGIGIAFLSLTAPREQVNEGHLRPLQVVAPLNTVVNPQRPAPCDSFGYIANRAVDLFLKALSGALPDMTAAGSNQVFGPYLYQMDPRYGRPFIYVEPFCGGYGARSSRDGASALIFSMDGDCHNEPVEIIETRYPLLVERHALDTESAGAGRHRGGCGVVKDYVILAEANVMLAGGNDSKVDPPWGLFGGGDGTTARYVPFAGTDDEQVIDERVNFFGPLKKGDRVSVHSSGGGGWGDPLERDPELVERDVRLGYISAEKSREVYGVVIRDDGTADLAATDTLRTRLGRVLESGD
jgi:N-methylhydantoinase B